MELLMEFIYQIDGMHCADCVEKIKSALALNFKIKEITLNPPILKIDANEQPSLVNLNNHISLAGKYSVYPVTENILLLLRKTISAISSPNECTFIIWLIALSQIP
jgi:copper chaperone CopZ